MRIHKLLSIVILLLIGCSSNEEILRDSRYKISNSPEWKINFSHKDSGSGIIFKFIKDKNIREIPESVNIYLWAYPLDTVAIIEKVNDEIQSLPSGGFADVTYIHYEIKNDPIKIFSKVDSTNQITKEISPNKYLLLIQSIGFTPIYLKDIRVVEGYWSTVETKMYWKPIVLY